MALTCNIQYFIESVINKNEICIKAESLNLPKLWTELLHKYENGNKHPNKNKIIQCA